MSLKFVRSRLFSRLSVTAHGVGAFWQKPILAKNARGERTLPETGRGRRYFSWCFCATAKFPGKITRFAICLANRQIAPQRKCRCPGVKQGPLRETPLAGNPQGALRTSDYRFTWALKYDYYAQTKRWVSSYDFSILLTAHVCMETIFRNGNIS